MEMRHVNFLYYAIVGAILFASQVCALELARPFTNHAVLQFGQVLPIWGKADAGAKVLVKLAGMNRSVKADSKGDWKVEFPPQAASTKPFKSVRLEVTSDNEIIECSDVLFGDVWLATGQSNMQWMLKQCDNAEAAVADSEDDGLRLFHHAGTLQPNHKKYPRDYLINLTPGNYYRSGGWKRAEPNTTANFSGVAYYFGRKLREELAIPIGIIQLAVGGTPIEAHLPLEAFESDLELKPLLKTWWKNPNYPVWCRSRAAHNLTHFLNDPVSGQEPAHPFAPTFLWQAGIEPLLPFPVKGVIWYQGESNTGKDGSPGSSTDGSLNKKKLKTLIKAWRRAWDASELPVYYVQLPGLNREWSIFREMQFEVSRELKHVGMAVIIDVGSPTDVHPSNKLPVGHRLARLALAKTYGCPMIPNGPMYQKFMVKGDQVYLAFENGEGMRAAEGGEILGFEISGANKKFYPAIATVLGDYVVIKSKEVEEPVAVRYAWANDPECNLVNGEALPASPFRTDRWKDVTPSGHIEKSKQRR